ncbi:MAG: hypothetical protein IPK55_13425 [Streptococcus sp.]|nr:hypothetical protein [Streptococcus sp.]
MYHMDVPSHLIGKSYSKLYKELALEQNSVPLGLYREYEIEYNCTDLEWQ